uniref:Inner membrane protein n=1 Tax=Angiostrongylus cantonensis TaxID=6313 RepID=A0A0K0CW96_ANGCA
MGILIIVLSTLIFAKFRAIQQKPQPASVLMSREKKFRQANRNCAGVLFISLVFVTFRSVFVGVTAIMGACTPLRVAVIIGPFYILGLICADVQCHLRRSEQGCASFACQLLWRERTYIRSSCQL